MLSNKQGYDDIVPLEEEADQISLGFDDGDQGQKAPKSHIEGSFIGKG